MASKGPRSKLDHETRARRQKALEAPKEPPRPKTHWDHVLEEMVWLSKDFESERKWKLAHAKKVALRASKGVLEFSNREGKKVKEEEQRLKKVALNISKDVKKFWIKIEKLVLYKHQLELEERKKKSLDKQLNFLLDQTERYSTMLAENLVDSPYFAKSVVEKLQISGETIKETPENGFSTTTGLDSLEKDDDYATQSEDDSDDDEKTIEEDEAHITESERKNELAALQAEADMPLDELLKIYKSKKVSREVSPEIIEALADPIVKKKQIKEFFTQETTGKEVSKDVPNISYARKDDKHLFFNCDLDNDSYKFQQVVSNGDFSFLKEKMALKSAQEQHNSEFDDLDGNYSIPSPGDEVDDRDYDNDDEEEQDDEATLSEEEKLAKNEVADPLDEIRLLQQECEMPIEELLAKYAKADSLPEMRNICPNSADMVNSLKNEKYGQHNEVLAVDDGGSCKDCDMGLDEFNSSSKELIIGEANKIDDKESEDIITDDAAAARFDQPTGNTKIDGRENEDTIADAAAAARLAQPTGNTFSTTKVRTKFPFLLKHPLREYQHIGLDWLVAMYEKRLNGILADEMGLGKTIMTIALLAHLACEKGIWGPHLIVVPTSVMLNWETEFLKWCPAFKILTYFGSAKERKHKRQGWLKPNYFHVCITTYRLVIQDSKVFKRKKWKYLILDEAHLIKNWKSQRWQTLLNFNSKRRILLTGTPLQNDLMELWSLMHFLMPHIFQSHQEFKDWFCNPISGMVEGQEKVNKDVVDRLHNVLRPFILRRLKRDVEKQLPQKYEHVIYCRLSKRQRNLYEDFIASSETQATLASANFFGMISVIMQLRKVCNHPDLFEGRPIVSSFDMEGIDTQTSSLVCSIISSGPFSGVDLIGLNFVFTQNDFNMNSWEVDEVASVAAPSSLLTGLEATHEIPSNINRCDQKKRAHGTNIFEEIQIALREERMNDLKERAARIAWWNSLQCKKTTVYGVNLRKLVTIKHPVYDIHEQRDCSSCYMNFSSRLADIVLSPVERFQKMLDLVEGFLFAIPAARAPMPFFWCSRQHTSAFLEPGYKEECGRVFSPLLSPFRPAIVRRQVYFPDRRLIQFDCGKLQELAVLLRRLKSEGHRALIFTQMTKMLDVLEAFINLYGYTYMRLDGSTPPEERQTLMQRFNSNPKYFLFILSTRSGGVGINLVGADTVIFYDSDWNPAMDQQAQDRCHRIGQTREVHIYRLISESTIEENILKKAGQKRALDDLVIQSGSYNTEFFKKLDPMELFSGHRTFDTEMQKGTTNDAESTDGNHVLLSNADVEAAIKHAEDEADYMALKKVEEEEAVDNQEFNEDVTSRLDDDELVNDDDNKLDEKNSEYQTVWIERKDTDTALSDNLNEEKALTLAEGDEDIDMLADVKQMAAAAAAAGQASSSFENHLRPIDRYAMRFMELWDPIVDKSSIENQAIVEEQEWELDRIEKFKDDLEAEIDEDQEPFLYERWDADFATMAYRQHVEALAQRQLLEDEGEDPSENELENENVAKKHDSERKSKTKKKSKKKFKSLKKGSLASGVEVVLVESPIDTMSVEDFVYSPEVSFPESPLHSPISKKRKKSIAQPDGESSSRKKSKKPKTASECSDMIVSDSSTKQLAVITDANIAKTTRDHDPKYLTKAKGGGKISILNVPTKRVMVLKPERLKKRGLVWSKDWFPSPDAWSTQEDAILCAMVHEFGTHWSLVSDALYSQAGTGFYRGRFRHPTNCCERYRELFSKYVLSNDGSDAEKITSTGSGKAFLKVTEDQAHSLVDVTSELPDNELLLEKHFFAVLASVWRTKCHIDQHQSMPYTRDSYVSSRSISSSNKEAYQSLSGIVSLTNLQYGSQAVATALGDACEEHEKETRVSGVQANQHATQSTIDMLDLVLTFPKDQMGYETAFPSAVDVTVYAQELPGETKEHLGQILLAESCRNAENRYRLASEACFEGEGYGWATSAFPVLEATRSRATSKSQTLGKHKSISVSAKPPKTKLQRISEPQEDQNSVSTFFLPSKRPILEEPWHISHSDSAQYDTTDALLEELEGTEFFQHEYQPDFLSGLADLDSLGIA